MRAPREWSVLRNHAIDDVVDDDDQMIVETEELAQVLPFLEKSDVSVASRDDRDDLEPGVRVVGRVHERSGAITLE